eukprot:227090-Chlamydomonas_euryale.AAC.4
MQTLLHCRRRWGPDGWGGPSAFRKGPRGGGTAGCAVDLAFDLARRLSRSRKQAGSKGSTGGGKGEAPARVRSAGRPTASEFGRK